MTVTLRLTDDDRARTVIVLPPEAGRGLRHAVSPTFNDGRALCGLNVEEWYSEAKRFDRCGEATPPAHVHVYVRGLRVLRGRRGAGKGRVAVKWTARRRHETRLRGVLRAGGQTVRLFQFPGSRFSWALGPMRGIRRRARLAIPANDNGSRLRLVAPTNDR